MTGWALLIEPEGRPGPHNMAIDAGLLARARTGGAFLRLYRWSPACLSFGRHEPATRRYDRPQIAARGLATVRRPTGGRAVWHDTEVTYAVAAPIARFGTLPESYHAIHVVLASALTHLGADVSLAPHTRPATTGAGACFATPVGGEVVSRRGKVVGSAQVRERDAFLQHGSILLENRQDVVASVTRGAAPPDGAVGLQDLLGRAVSFETVAAAIAATAASEWSGAWTTAEAMKPPVPNPYEDESWTWGR